MDELDRLARLLRRYSPSGREAAAVREFLRQARELGYATRVDGVGNGIARIGSGRPRVVFLGHIDTVEGKLPVLRRGERLFGRGAVDAKGPLLAALLAGRARGAAGMFEVVAAVGEETDSRGTRHLLRRAPPDALIAGEPSGWDGIALGYKGALGVRATFRGARTHSSSPVPTASDRAVSWIIAVRSLVAGRDGGSPFRSLTAKTTGLASAPRGPIELAEVCLDLRLPPGTDTAGVERELRALEGPDALEVTGRVEPIEVERSNPVVTALVAGVREVGGRPTLYRKGGTSDLNLAVRAWGVPGAAYGPGDPHLDHTDQERLSLADLGRAVRVLEVARERLGRSLLTPRRSDENA